MSTRKINVHGALGPFRASHERKPSIRDLLHDVTHHASPTISCVRRPTPQRNNQLQSEPISIPKSSSARRPRGVASVRSLWLLLQTCASSRRIPLRQQCRLEICPKNTGHSFDVTKFRIMHRVMFLCDRCKRRARTDLSVVSYKHLEDKYHCR